MILRIGVLSVCILVLSASAVAAQPASSVAAQDLIDAFSKLTRNTAWRLVQAQPVHFDTYHPQGFAKIGDMLFVSSVEIVERTKRYVEPIEGMDRSTGQGTGHLFKMDLAGNLLAHIEIGEGSIYHPGGIDFDGTYLWIPVAEYRPDSHSIIYRIDSETLIVEEVMQVADHIGGIVHDTETGLLHGVSWGARRFYRWDPNAQAHTAETEPPTPNPSHYIDYQDCQYAGRNRAICSGLSTYWKDTGTRFALGGLELLDLNSGQAIHQVPFPYWTDHGLAMTQNPMVIELNQDILRLYLMPEDNNSTLYTFEVVIP